MICPNKRSKSWKNLVAARGETEAYNLFFKYKGEVPDSEYVAPVSERGMQDPYIREKYFYDEPVEGFLKSSTVVERISKSSHPLNKVAEYLLPYINKINDSTIHLFDTNEYLNYSGIYDLDQNHININKNAYFKGRGSEPTIIHEVIHSLTMGSIISNTENVQKLNEVYEYLKPMFPAYNEKTKEGTYAMKNLDEFIVALFSDSAFIKELIKIPAIDKSKTSILQEVFDYILSLFNISEEDSVYRQAFNVASNILEDAALYSDFQKDQYEATYYMSPQANPNFAAQLKQWHDNKGKYYTNNKNQADDTYKRLVNFYTNAKVKRPYQINNNLWVVNVSKPVDAAVEEDIKRVTNEGYNKDYIPRIKRVGANQWMTPEGDIVSDADAKDFMSFEDVQAPESLSKFKPIKATDKIIWGHPGIGKSFLREFNSNIIDFDSDYKSRINEKYNLPEGFKARNQWRESNPELWKEEIRQLWSEAKQESQDTGKQLLASDMILLREFPNDFDKVVNISDETFIDRVKQRDDYTEGETEKWKANINEVLGNIDQSKIIQTDKYLSDLLSEETLPKFKVIKPGVNDVFNQNPELTSIGTPEQYSAYLDTIFPDSKLKDIVYHGVTKGKEAYNNILQNGFLTTNKSNWSNDKDKEFKGVFFTDLATATSYGVNLERELRPEEKDFVIPAILNVETLLTPKMGLVSGTVTKLRNENLDVQNLGVQGEEGSEGVHENTVVFEPEQIYILGSQKDVEGFKDFVSTPESLPKFKPKPANTLSDLEVEQFKAALETSLQVGGTINFNYWSESTSQQISEKNIEILSIDDNSFTGRYLNGEERVFRYKNMISKAVPGKYEMHEQAYFKSNLEIGKTVTVESNGLIYSGTITEIGNEDFSIIDAAGDKYTLRYEELDKENYQRKIFQRASEMKKLLEEQIERFSKTAKSEFQVERIALLQQALTHLDTYRGTANLIEFMKVMQTAVFKSRALMKNLSESKELPENEGDKIAEINRRLSMISFLKDYVDSMMEFHKMSYDIYESDSSQELKDKAALLGLEIKYAADTFYEVAIPNLADWLWMCFPKKLNSQLLLVGEKELTKEDLIKELMQPRKDLDFFNSYGVPVANANDMITGLFSKAIKRTLQYAKELHLKLERDLLPYFKKVQDTGANMTEIYKKFYTIKEMETEEEVDVDGVLKVMPVKKNVRVFIEKYDLQKYYDTVRDFKAEIKALGEKIELSTSTNERSALIDQKKKLSARLKAYQKVTAFNYSAPQMNEMMEKLRKNNVPKFLENLKYFYKIGPESENSLKYENEGTVIYYNYTGNFYKPNKEAIDPDTGNKIFLTPEYENLMNEPQETIDLYNEMKSIYDEKNNMLPEHLRLNGVVPVVYEQSILRDASKTLKNRNKYNDAQELRNKEKKTTTKLNGEPYQNVPLGYTRILDVNESSDNIMQSFLYWANDVQMYRAKNDVISSVDVLAKTLEKNSPLEEGETYRSRINRRAEVIKKYANQVLYGETRASNEWWDRVFDYMGKFTAVTRMFIKPSSAINNLIIGNYALLSEAIGGRNFTQKDLAKAYKKYVDLLITNKKKLNNMIVTLDAVQGRFKDEIGADFQTNQDTFGLNTAFALNNRVEHEIQAVSMLALLEKWGVEIPEDGVFESDQLPDNFLGTLHELNKANNGVYSESDRLYHQDESLFRMFMQFRKYIVPTFRSKYSGMTQKGNNKYRMDFEAGSLELGYYRAFGEFVWENIIKIWNLPKIGENWKNLNEIEREGFWRSVVDAVGFLSISFLFLPLAGADDDDWDSEEYGFFENLVHWETIYQLARLRGDIGTYIPGFGFSDQSRLVNQPFAALSTLNQLAKIAKLTFDLKEDNEGNISIWKVYERDYGRYEKGDLKILQPISKLNPLDNPYEDLFPHIQYNDFKAASR